MRRGFLSAVLLCALAVPLAAQPAFLTNLGPQLPGSDFSGWHSEQVRGFATFGHVQCDAMVGDSGLTVWDNGNPAFSASGSKNGGCRMAAGKLMLLKSG